MKTFFKRSAESDLGAGMVYLEVKDGWPSRQVEVYGDQWRAANEKHNEWLADQPLEELGLEEDDQIDEAEFEAVWSEALKRCPQLL
jgi:hypothetical protein